MASTRAATSNNPNEVMETVFELAQLLNTGLDRETLTILMALIQKGVNPEALANVVKELRKEADRMKNTTNPNGAASSGVQLAHKGTDGKDFNF